MDTNKEKYNLNDLKNLMSRLRSPDNGCPWDLEQTFSTIKPHTIEEAYEVADAIERDNMTDLKDELGDLLFQVMFHAQIASESGIFTVDDVIDHVTKKMIFRHPHVFTDKTAVDADDVETNIWEQQKAKEKGEVNEHSHYLDDVTRALPSLSLANKIQKRVRKIGFEYPDFDTALNKLDEEIQELKQVVKIDNKNDINEEFGDVLFTVALLGEHIDVNAEESLRQGCLKFIKRFNAVENDLKSQKIALRDASITEMEKSWIKIKEGI